MEESGWKLVHGDVFRPPQYPMILSSLLGSGIQLFCMILIVICEWACGAGVGWGKQHRPESEEWASLPGAGGFVSLSGPDRSICPSRRAGPLSHRPQCFAPQIFPAPSIAPPQPHRQRSHGSARGGWPPFAARHYMTYPFPRQD